MLARLSSTSFKLNFSSIWTKNFQMYILGFTEPEVPEIKLPTSIGPSKKQESSRKMSTSALLTMPKPLTVWITINCGKFLNVPDHLTCLLRNLYAGQEAIVRTRHGTIDWSKLRKEYNKAVYSHPAYLTYMQSRISWKCWAGWIISWKQGCWEKYHQPQICNRWYHSNDRK